MLKGISTNLKISSLQQYKLKISGINEKEKKNKYVWKQENKAYIEGERINH